VSCGRLGSGGPLVIQPGAVGSFVDVPIPDAARICTVYGPGVAVGLTWLQGPVGTLQPDTAPWDTLPGPPGRNNSGRVTIPCAATALRITLAAPSVAPIQAWIGWER
jgi:hypothetical protein